MRVVIFSVDAYVQPMSYARYLHRIRRSAQLIFASSPSSVGI